MGVECMEFVECISHFPTAGPKYCDIQKEEIFILARIFIQLLGKNGMVEGHGRGKLCNSWKPGISRRDRKELPFTSWLQPPTSSNLALALSSTYTYSGPHDPVTF